MKKILKNILKYMGINIKISWQKNNSLNFLKDFDHNLGYDLENEANDAIKKVRKNTMLPYSRLITLYQQAVYCEKKSIKGSFIECGVWKGGAIGLMALANLKTGIERREIHLFDIFDNICEPNPEKDGKQSLFEANKYAGIKSVTGRLKPMKGIYDHLGGYGSIEDNKILLEEIIGYPSQYLHYHKGWFQDTIQKDSKDINEIAILRIDGDWYESVLICLKYLYPKVIKNGFVIIDDYGHYEGCTKAVNEYFQENKLMPFLHHINYGGRYWIK